LSPSDFHDGRWPAFPPPPLVDTTHHHRGSLTLPRWPSRHAAPTTSDWKRRVLRSVAPPPPSGLTL